MNRLCCSEKPCGCCETEKSGCGEYIVEKVIQRDSQTCCYQGLLSIDEVLGACLPLCLKAIEVMGITAICQHGSCACGTQMLRLTLILLMEDTKGCRFQTVTQIDVEACNKQSRSAAWNVNIRRGARVCIRRSHFCTQVGFDVELMIEIETVVSRLAFMGHEECKVSACPQLPLYPPPPCRNFQSEHFCG